MRRPWISGLLFIVYCAEAGIFLVMAPWSPSWERLVGYVPIQSLYLVLLLPLVRGAVSGFGLVHLVWGVHDLQSWLASRKYHGRVGS